MDFGNYGERQAAQTKDWGYYAHLSIYDFAKERCRNRDCLEIGSGTGYGARYLKDAGARSYTAIDKQPEVVEDLNKRNPDIRFLVRDLDLEGLGLEVNGFDLLFSSNVFEHIVDIDSVLESCIKVLKPTGTAIIAVPPITQLGELEGNARNVFHINNIPIWAWEKKLNRYFEDVSYFRHWMTQSHISSSGVIDFHKETKIEDFIFIDSASVTEPSITAVFLCERPRTVSMPNKGGEVCPPEWKAEKISAEARQAEFVRLSRNYETVVSSYREEISKLYSWAEGSVEQGASAETVLAGVMRQLGYLNAR